MIRMWLVGALLLTACRGEPEPSPATKPTAGVSGATPASAAADAPGAIAAVLDGTTEPRRAGRFAPRDDCAKTPGARAFREKLAGAVLRGDADAIAALALPDVKLGFGGDDGRERLLSLLKEPDSAALRDLGEVLSLGCAVDADGEALTMPWYFEQDFGADVDPFKAMLVTGADVPLLASPVDGAQARKRVSWDVVTLAGESYDPEKPYAHVKLSDGTEGYIAAESLRSVLAKRLLANRKGDEWRISAFVAGD